MKKYNEIKVAGCALRTAVCIGIAICLLPLFVGAQEVPQGVTISSSPNPVGSGARALGMGGAFIAIADDATAASWNPAGLSRLRKPEFSFALSWFSCREDYSSRRHPEAEGLQKGLARDLNFMSLALPFKLFKRNMIVSLNYQRLYEFERDISTSFSTTYLDTAMPMMGQFRQRIDFEQAGALKAFSPAYAVQVTPDLALGITLNIWTDKLFWSNGWEADTVHHAVAAEAGRQPVQFSSFTHDRYYGFHGWNLNLGFLWDATEMLSIGAVIKTPFRAEMRHEQSFSATTRYANGMILHTSNRLREDVDLEMPLSYGFGVALRWSDRLSFSCDVFRTEWSHFILEDGRRRRMSPITGMPSQDVHIKATHQVRLGAEYLLVFQKTIVPLRCGLFYDPEPSENNPEDYWGFSVGTGIPVGRMVFDIAYQFRRGADVEGEVIGVAQTSADVTQHLVLVSAIYHF